MTVALVPGRGSAEQLQEELERWLDDQLPAGWPDKSALPRGSARLVWLRDWQRRMAEARWVAIHWPAEHGGRDASLEEQVVFHATMARREAPDLIGHTGVSVCGPSILVHGTDVQRARFLPPMLRGEEVWCEGFSEPEAGSDLAGLRTRGVIDGDDLVITGQKVWTSGASIAEWMFALVRTNAEAPKRDGISFVLIPMDADGVAVRPIRQISGDAEFSEVFLEQVRVPLSNVVGGIDGGWRVARTSLAHERSTLFVAGQLRMARQLDQLIRLFAQAHDPWTARSMAADPHLRGRLAQAWIDARLAGVHGARSFAKVAGGGEPGPESAIMKLYGQEAQQRLFELATELAGPAGLLDRGSPEAPDGGKWLLGYLRSRASTIGGGTSEIQRNILAERVLGLPRDPWNP